VETIVLLISLMVPIGCPQPKIDNISGHRWNKDDQRSLEKNSKFCERQYKDSKCVIEFIKRKPRAYHIVCGGPNER
jgi:hypothetical protein